MRFDYIERILSDLFCQYARIVSKYPWLFICGPLIISVCLSTGCLWGFSLLNDDVDLYSPSDGFSMREKFVLDRHFDISDENLHFPERRYDYKRSGYFIVTAKVPKKLSNVLTAQVFSAALALWKNVKSILIRDELEWYNYEDLCVRTPANVCVDNPLLTAYAQNPLFLSRLSYPVNGSGLYLSAFLGHVTLYPNSTTIKTAKALLVPYQLRYQGNDVRAKRWELELETALKAFYSPIIDVHWWTSEIPAKEAEKDRAMVLRLFGPLFVIISGFTVFCCFIGSWVRSKPELGVGGVISAAASILSAIGLLSFTGQPFTSVAFFVPFVVFAIGVDNVFILVAAWQKTSTELSLEERMGTVFREAGVSITVTSLTDALSFGFGCLISFPSVQVFCLYASVAIIFVYLFQVTFFAGLMVISGRREAANRHCLLCVPMTRQTDNPAASKPDDACGNDVNDPMISRFFRVYYTDFVTKPLVQMIVIAIFFVYIGLAAWGCTELKIGLTIHDLIHPKDQSHVALDLRDNLFQDYSGQLHVAFTNLTDSLDFDRPFWLYLQQEISQFENTEFTGYSDSWLRVFLAFVQTARIELTPQNFMSVLEHNFLVHPAYEKYRSDLEMNLIRTRLLSFRLPVALKNLGIKNESKAITSLRKLAKSSSLNATVYSPFFLFADQYSTILPVILINVCIASLAVVCVSLLLIPKPLCALWVSLTIISINVGVIGYMSFWSVKLDFVSMVTLVMSIGFSVDFSAHIAYHFAKNKGLSTTERIRSALYSVGTPIVQSALSTLFGISLLVFVDSYVYRSFLKTVFLVIVLGTFHGLIVLPVLLTVFHCERPARSVETNNDDLWQPDHTDPRPPEFYETIRTQQNCFNYGFDPGFGGHYASSPVQDQINQRNNFTLSRQKPPLPPPRVGRQPIMPPSHDSRIGLQLL